MDTAKLFKSAVQGLFLFFVFSLLVVLAADTKAAYEFRLYLGFSLFLFALFAGYYKDFFRPLSFSSVLLLIFLLFEWSRFLYWVISKQAPSDLFPPTKWSFYAVAFFMGYAGFRKKEDILRFFNVTFLTCFFLALNAIPSLLKQKEMFGYALPNGSKTNFFFPFLLAHPWINKHLLASFAHHNWVGDVLSFGFYAALGAAVYFMFLFKDKKIRDFKTGRKEFSDRAALNVIALKIVIALVIVSAILLIFSRGTIVCLILSLLLYFSALVAKYPSKGMFTLAAGLFIGLICFGSWAGNLKLALREVGTLTEEHKALEGNKRDVKMRSSIDMNIEGARIAKAMHKEYPVWGVGTDQYEKVSKQFFIKGVTENYLLARRRAMSHYLHVLAEEGRGAYLYFLFLFCCVAEVFWRLFKTHSRFQFLMGLSLFTPVFLVLIHASFLHSMQTFGMSSLVYLMIGACLGILRVSETSLIK